MTSQTIATPSVNDLRAQAQRALNAIGCEATIESSESSALTARSPINGQSLGAITSSLANTSVEQAIATATEIFRTWRAVPAPVRGEVVRHLVVDDDLRLDVEGAQKAGLTGIWLNRHETDKSAQQAHIEPDATLASLHELEQWLHLRSTNLPESLSK